MKRKSLLLLTAMTLFVASLATADQAITRKDGFAWETGGFPPSNVGDVLNIVCIAYEVDPSFNIDLTQDEITVYSTDLLSTGQVDLGGGVLSTSYSGGTIELWQDPSKDAEYGIGPPNATVPSTFTNGSLFLGGTFLDFILVFNTNNGRGAYEGHINFTSGSGLTTLNQTEANGYTFAGVFDESGAVVPTGYDLQVDGRIEVEVLVSVQEKTWGGVKDLFRR